MKKIKLLIMFLIALLIGLSSCSSEGLGGVGDQLGGIKDQIGDSLEDSAVLKETLITSIDEVLTKEGFKKCVQNLREYDFSKVKDWNAEIASVVNLFEILHSVRNNEFNVDEFVTHYETVRNTVFVNDVLIKCSSEIVPLLPVIKDYYNESVVIKDWGQELDACVYSLQTLYNNDIKSLNDIINEDSKLNGSMMITFMDSELIKAVLVKEINKKLSESELINLEITKADLEQIDTADKWDLELDALFDLIDIANDASNLEYSEIVDIYAEVKLTILCKQILVDVAPDLAETLPVVSTYYNESIVIEDWEAELDAIIASVDALDKANITNLNDLLNEESALDGEMMLTFTQSIILKNALVEELNKALEQANLEPNLITIEDIDALESSELWDKELSAMRNLISLKDNSSTLEFSEIVEIYNEVRTTSLCNKVLISSAPVMAETLPVVSDYYDESVVIEDWGVELDAIVASVDALDKSGLEDFNDLLAEDSPLDGAIMITFLQSTILKNAVVDEINKALESTGLESNLITLADVESLSEEAWNAELSAMRNLISLKDNASTLEFSEIVEIYNEVRATSLCNKVLIASAPVMAETLPVVSDYYDESVVIEDWGVELDAIIASVDALDKSGLEDFNDLLAEDSPLDGAIMLTFLQSIILKNAVVEEINSALENAGLESGLITLTDVESLSEEAWNAELSAMRNLIALKDNASTLEFNEIVDIYEDLRATTICNKVLLASAPVMAETLPVVSVYYDETVVIEDWGVELDAIIATLDALSEANATAITNPLAEDSPLNGKVLYCATQSTILTKAIVDEINNAVKTSGLAENIITIENVQAVDSVDAWNAELDCMRRLVAIDFANTNMNTVIDIYDDIKENTILCDSILVSSAAIIIPDLPIICNYYDESLGITDWSVELDTIVNAYKLLVNKGLANINNPIQTLDGEIIIACLESKILKAAFIQEFNNNLTLLGLGAYYTMDEDKLAELDTAEKWDNELAAIQAVSDLVNNFSFTKIPTVKAQVESTIIAKAILASFLSSMGIIL